MPFIFKLISISIQIKLRLVKCKCLYSCTVHTVLDSRKEKQAEKVCDQLLREIKQLITD